MMTVLKDSVRNLLLVAPIALILVAMSCNDAAGMRRLLVEAERHNGEMHAHSMDDRAATRATVADVRDRLAAAERTQAAVLVRLKRLEDRTAEATRP